MTKRRVVRPINGGCLLKVALLAIVIILLVPRTNVAKVTALQWKRTVSIQEHQYNAKEGWALPPADADLINTKERIRYNEEDIVEYHTYYYYRVWEWVATTPIIAQGENNKPYWPEVSLDQNYRETPGPEGRSEYYCVTFITTKNKSYSYFPTDAEEFSKYHIGTQWKIKINTILVTKVLKRID